MWDRSINFNECRLRVDKKIKKKKNEKKKKIGTDKNIHSTAFRPSDIDIRIYKLRYFRNELFLSMKLSLMKNYKFYPLFPFLFIRNFISVILLLLLSLCYLYY